MTDETAAAEAEAGAAPAEGATDAQTPPADAGTDAAADTGAEAGTEGEAPSVYRAEGMGDEDAGATDQETIDKLWKRVGDLRGKLGKGAPKSADEYGDPVFSDDFVKAHGEGAIAPDDPVITIVKNRALAAGISPDAFGPLVGGIVEDALAAGVIEKPLSMDAEFEAAGGKEKYQSRMTEIDRRLDGLVAQGAVPQEAREAFKAAYATASDMAVVEAIFGLARESGVQLGAGGNPGGVTQESVRKEMRDPRYQEGTKEYDPAFRKEVDKRAEKVFGPQ